MTIHSVVIGTGSVNTRSSPVISSSPYAGFAIRLSMNLMVFTANPVCVGSFPARPIQIP
jgi:hypothetical protein